MAKIKLGRYKHFKGRVYEVIGVAKHSETSEEMVVYRTLYKSKDFGKNALWIRPLKMFLEKVKINSKQTQRFKFIEEEEKAI